MKYMPKGMCCGVSEQFWFDTLTRNFLNYDDSENDEEADKGLDAKYLHLNADTSTDQTLA